MSDSDYKRGVEDATKAFSYDEITVLPVTEGFNSNVLRTFLNNRRKKLLTRKVTKWVNIYTDSQLAWSPLHQGFGLYDSEDLAKAQNPESWTGYLGTYPVEIDLPL
jgi:hypothetical protein